MKKPNEFNQYDNHININHPAVSRWYQAYKQELKVPVFASMTDRQRKEFESVMDALWERGHLPNDIFNKRKGPPISDSRQAY